MWQGDIVLDPDEFEKGWNNTQYASIKGGRWPGGRVPYIIDRSISKSKFVTFLNFNSHHMAYR